MSTSAAEAGVRIGRSYTRARRLPWVMGKVGDWTLPFGPYTPAQIAVAFVGAFVLIKTFAWWRVLGPVPVVALAVAVWAVRRARIGGRSPFNYALGTLTYLAQPRAGRINGRGVRPERPVVLHGGCVIEDTPAAATATEASVVRASRSPFGMGRKAVRLMDASTVRRARPGRGEAPAVSGELPALTAMQQMLRDRQATKQIEGAGGEQS